MRSLTKKISNALKSLREERSLSLDAVSKKTGVSKAMLGQIEREESIPTIATLWKIASGLNVSFSYFIGNLKSINFIHSISHLHKMHPQDDKIKIMPLFTYDKHLEFEVFIIELLPGCEHLSPPHQKGVIEHIIVASGEIEVFINGTWHLVKQHEGLRFNAAKPHGYRNTSSRTAIFHDMIHYPSNRRE